MLLNRSNTLMTVAAALLLAAPMTIAGAQGRGRGNGGVPPGQRPPAGMCRVWIDGVPPGRQPAATDCVTARRTAPANSRIIYGDDEPFPGRGRGRQADRSRTSNGDVVSGGTSRACGTWGDVILNGGRSTCVPRDSRTDRSQPVYRDGTNTRDRTYRGDVREDREDRADREDGDDDRGGGRAKSAKHENHGKGHGHGKHGRSDD